MKAWRYYVLQYYTKYSSYIGYKTRFISTWQHEKQLYSNVQDMVAVLSDKAINGLL